MAAVILEHPPNDGHLWIPSNALGSGFKIVYTLGRNDGGYLNRKKRTAIHTEITHIMGNGDVSPQGFANSETNSGATLAEIATFPTGNGPYGKPTLLQSLPLDIIGAGSVAGGATGITHESSNTVAGDTNAMVWDPGHVALKATLTAWLIRNPLARAGDRKWQKMDIRYQICKSPYGPTAALGGLGDHTMWDTCGIQAGGTNPWTLYCKSCPGWRRRGTQRRVQFPNGLVTDIPFEPGNFRDYYQRVGALLNPGGDPEEPDMTPEDHAAIKAQFDAVFAVLASKPPLGEIHNSSATIVNGTITEARHKGILEKYVPPLLDDIEARLAAIEAKLGSGGGDVSVAPLYRFEGTATPLPAEPA